MQVGNNNRPVDELRARQLDALLKCVTVLLDLLVQSDDVGGALDCERRSLDVVLVDELHKNLTSSSQVRPIAVLLEEQTARHTSRAKPGVSRGCSDGSVSRLGAAEQPISALDC